MEGQHEQFMKLAIEQAIKGMDAGEQPFGSVIVRTGRSSAAPTTCRIPDLMPLPTLKHLSSETRRSIRKSIRSPAAPSTQPVNPA